MKKIFWLATSAFVLLAALPFLAFRHVQPAVRGIIEDLGITEATAQSYMFDAFSSESSLRVPAFRSLAKVAAGNRAAVAQAYCEYIKQYVKSPAFAERYEQWRQSYKPRGAPNPMPEDTKRELRALYTESLKSYEDLRKSLPASQQSTIEQAIQETRRAMRELDDPNPQLTDWEKRYPARPDARIKSIIEKFLEMTDKVDFNAELRKDARGKMKFVNPAYEQKPEAWKMCYRGGQEATATVRKFMQEWLKEYQ